MAKIEYLCPKMFLRRKRQIFEQLQDYKIQLKIVISDRANMLKVK